MRKRIWDKVCAAGSSLRDAVAMDAVAKDAVVRELVARDPETSEITAAGIATVVAKEVRLKPAVTDIPVYVDPFKLDDLGTRRWSWVNNSEKKVLQFI